jgi:uncharacterized protein (TIGR02145 family)
MKKIIFPIFAFMIGIALNAQTVKDVDGNDYKTVTIGSQVWMVENLRTTKYNDGTSIPLVTDKLAWSNLKTPAYCWYDNEQSKYDSVYGVIYNWYVVNTEKLCPIAWHIPSDTEWTTLTDYLKGIKVAGGKLKETGTTHWIINIDGTNKSGFTALPGGTRNQMGGFHYIEEKGFWWSSTQNSIISAWYRAVYSDQKYIGRYTLEKSNGFSVRCVKD